MAVYIPGILAGVTFGVQLAVEVWGLWSQGDVTAEGIKWSSPSLLLVLVSRYQKFLVQTLLVCVRSPTKMSPKPWEG